MAPLYNLPRYQRDVQCKCVIQHINRVEINIRCVIDMLMISNPMIFHSGGLCIYLSQLGSDPAIFNANYDITTAIKSPPVVEGCDGG